MRSVISCVRLGLLTATNRRGVTPLVTLQNFPGHSSAKSRSTVCFNNSEWKAARRRRLYGYRRTRGEPCARSVARFTLDLPRNDRREPHLLRILLYSEFGAKCGAPHFVPLLLKRLSAGKSSANEIKRGRIANVDNCHFPVAHPIRSLVISLEDYLPPLM
jgi:hypothetical protein